MITYGYSLQGKSHIDRNTVCQDSSAAVKLKSGYYLGVVADGVGVRRIPMLDPELQWKVCRRIVNNM